MVIIVGSLSVNRVETLAFQANRFQHQVGQVDPSGASGGATVRAI